jgi:hypothetical protein
MIDTARREGIKAAVDAARAAVDAFDQTLVDPGMKELLLRRVRYGLDDVNTMFLSHADQNRSPMLEKAWLDFAEATLRSALEQFQQLKTLTDKYGGPKNVKAIG